MKRCPPNFFIIVCLWMTFLSGNAQAAEERDIVQRIYSHLLLSDIGSAKAEVLQGLQKYPDSKTLQVAYIKVMAREGNEKMMVTAWKKCIKDFPEESEDRDLLETMAWGVIEKAAVSSCPITRVMAMLGAFFSQDVKGVAILQNNMQDSNSLIRAASVELSSYLRDDKLKDEVQRLFKQEKNWAVHLLTIQAAGKMKITSMRSTLEEIVADDKSPAEERTAAIEALVNLTDNCDRNEVLHLSKCDRAGLRLLSCELINYYGDESLLEIIFPLLQDTHCEVRAAAVQTIGVLRPPGIKGREIAEKIYPMVHDPDPTVAISAGWVISLYYPSLGFQALSPWLNDELQERRVLAATAIASAPSLDQTDVMQTFRKAQDPYVRLNIALAMIPQRCETTHACNEVSLSLINQKERWNWFQKGIFRMLLPAKNRANEDLTASPEAVNQMVRLEILNMLAMLNDPRAPEAIKNFLQDKSWGLSGIAASLLLTEGDEPALDLVRGLLQDPDPRVRLQAALVLALWGREESAIAILQEAYPRESRENKSRILEALGKVGAISTVPFLVDALQESQQTLRVIAAAALIQCLNH